MKDLFIFGIIFFGLVYFLGWMGAIVAMLMLIAIGAATSD